MEIKVHKESVIYILCPPKYATGGTELLHQLCDALIKIGVNAKMFYWPNTSNPTSEQFKEYQISIASKIVDTPQNIFIAPEIDNYKIFEFYKIQKVIWWLSIDNHFKNIKIRKRNLKIRFLDFFFRRTYFSFNSKETNNVTHFAQSFYAKEFLNEKGIKNVELLSDYTNNRFLKEIFDKTKKENIVLYNPKKGIRNTQRLIKASNSQFKWVPIENLTREGVLKLLKRAKVYVDFGNHPGKDRFPREAAILGCCIITNKEGAAVNTHDVSIPERFKFDRDADIHSVLSTIEDCMTNYSEVIHEFEGYRNKILKEKDIFFKEVEKIFKKEAV